MATRALTRTNEKNSIKPTGGRQATTDRYLQAVSNELLGRLHGETASSELVGRVATVSSRDMRDVTALPNAAVSHFNRELTKTPKRRKRTRR
jgi:hypothetical protein